MSVIIATIIEMILPNGNNSKYIKMVIGVFILFTIISPVLNKLKGNNNELLDMDEYIDVSSSKYMELPNKLNNDDLIRNMYIENLKIDIKSKLSQKGYVVGNINVNVLDNDEYTLDSLYVNVIGTSTNVNNNSPNTATIVENVGQILINVSGGNETTKKEEKSVISFSEKRKITQYLSSVYEVSEKKIYVE